MKTEQEIRKDLETYRWILKQGVSELEETRVKAAIKELEWVLGEIEK